MTLGLLARKVGMTQIFNDRGQAEPVTVLEAGPCPVMQVRTSERDGYHAVQRPVHRRVANSSCAPVTAAAGVC